jgi:phage replication-related protein YjqB (UPF0714/DUF867 family)
LDQYRKFEDLRNNESPEFYTIYKTDRMSCFLLFSPHAGGIEPGTSEICKQIAGNTYSYYLFSGNGGNCKRLHITSTHFDEPVLLGLLAKHKYSVSIHGMTNEMKNKAGADIFLGGLNHTLITISTIILRELQFEVINNIKMSESEHSGIDQRNVTNRCISGEGMQVEISEELRSAFFEGDFKKKKGRKDTTNIFKAFCDAMVQSIAIFELNFCNGKS